MSEQITEKKQDLKQTVYSREQYAKANFWEDRYVQNGGFFDWYAELPELNPVFKEYGIQNEDKVLMVGCGNSKLSGQMFENGYSNVINIDISPSVINQMKEKFPDLVWQVMDATNLQYKDGQFDVVMDKGTLDALISGRNFQVCEAMLKESMRVTKQNGQLIIITYGSPQGRRKIFQKALPFDKYDFYQCRAELNDMSTMINLMRSNAPHEPLKNIIKNSQAFAKTMKQFMIIKMMRKTRKNKKQLVVWNKHQTSEIQVNSSHLRQDEKKNEIADGKPADNQNKVEAKNEQQPNKTESNQVNKGQAPNALFTYQPKKQPYVYVYSIRRKLTYNMQESLSGKTKQNLEQQFPLNQQGLRIVTGYQNERPISIIVPENKMNSGLKAVSFLKFKGNSHRTVLLSQNINEFLDKSIKIHIKSTSSTPKYCCLRKTNFTVKFILSSKVKVEQILTKLNKIIRILVDKGNLHPDPRVYALLGVLKNRRLMHSVNDLLQKYWFPSWRLINCNPEDVNVEFSFPPVNSTTQDKLLEILRLYFNNVKMEISIVRQGFVSLIDLQLYGIINMGSLSLIGQPTDLVVDEFWSEDSISKEVEILVNQKNEYRQIQQAIFIQQSAIQKLLVHIIGLY